MAQPLYVPALETSPCTCKTANKRVESQITCSHINVLSAVDECFRHMTDWWRDVKLWPYPWSLKGPGGQNLICGEHLHRAAYVPPQVQLRCAAEKAVQWPLIALQQEIFYIEEVSLTSQGRVTLTIIGLSSSSIWPAALYPSGYTFFYSLQLPKSSLYRFSVFKWWTCGCILVFFH